MSSRVQAPSLQRLKLALVWKSSSVLGPLPWKMAVYFDVRGLYVSRFLELVPLTPSLRHRREHALLLWRRPSGHFYLPYFIQVVQLSQPILKWCISVDSPILIFPHATALTISCPATAMMRSCPTGYPSLLFTIGSPIVPEVLLVHPLETCH